MKKGFLLMAFLLFCTLGVWAQEAVQFGRYSVVPEQNVRAARTRSVAGSSLELGLPVGGRVNVLMQFARIPSAKELKALEVQGVRLSDYVGGNAYLATVQPGSRPSDFRGVGAVSVIPMRPEWKLSTPLADGDVPSWAQRGSNLVEVTLYWFSNVNAAFVRAFMEERGYAVGEVSDQLSAMTATLPLSAVREVAAEPWVQYVAPADPPQELYNYGGRLLSAGTIATQPVDLGGRGLTGKGVRVGLWDGNVEHHVDYGDRVHVLEFELSVASSEGHGMHTCGTIMGAGLLNPKARGMAPKVELWASNFNEQRNGLLVAEEMADLYEQQNIALTSNSYGAPLSRLCGLYKMMSYSFSSSPMLTDMLCNTYPLMSHFFSAGNDQGSCGLSYGSNFARAKNVIYVGAVTGYGYMSRFSSFGPMDDGRLMPTVSAKGVDVLSTVGANGYEMMSGTSMSCPTTAGMATLLTERYHQLHGGQNLNSALMKGLLANTADDWGNAGPDYQYGYGIVNLEAALTALEHGWYAEGAVTSGELALPHRINVPSGVKQLRVMLTWIDPVVVKAYPYGAPALINDLDLTVEVGGATVRPWVLDKEHPEKEAVRGEDNINNIEQVTVDNPVAGEAVVRIGGQNKIANGPEQKYVLTWYFDYEKPELLHPIGGEVFSAGEVVMVRANNMVGDTRVELSCDGGKTYTYLGSVDDMYSIETTIPVDAPMTTNAIMRLTDSEGNVLVSPNPFTIAPTPQDLKYEATPCDPNSWKLQWTPAAGVEKYAVLKADVPTGEWTEIAEVTDATYAIPAAQVTQGGRNVYAVAVKMEDGKLGPRSLGILVAEPTNMAVKDATLPFAETFVEIPLRHARIVAGANMRIEWQETPAYLEYPVGSHTLILKSDKEATGELFAVESNIATLMHCELNLEGISHGKKILFNATGMLTTFDKAEDGQLRLLVNDVVKPTVQGANSYLAEGTIRNMAWDISGYAGQKVKIELQFACNVSSGKVSIFEYGIKEALTHPDVGLFLGNKKNNKVNMGVEDLLINLYNSSLTPLAEVPIVVTKDGEVVITRVEKNLKPYEERLIKLPVDFSTPNPEGHIFDVKVVAMLDGDVNPKDNESHVEFYNMGDVYAFPPADPVIFGGMKILREYHEIKRIDKPLLFTDDGGALKPYGPDHLSAVKFVPEDPNKTLCMTVRECKVYGSDVFGIYADGLPGDFVFDDVIPTYEFSSRDGGGTRIFISTAADGAITAAFVARGYVRSSDGWVVEVRQIDRVNSLTLLPIELENNYPSGQAQIKIKVKNHTPQEQKNVPGVLKSSVLPKDVHFTIPSIPANDQVEYTIDEKLNVPYPSCVDVTVTLNGVDAEVRDNTQTATLWNDKFWRGGKIEKPESQGLMYTAIYPDTIDLVANNPFQDYHLDTALSFYLGTINPLTIGIQKAPVDGDPAASLHVWIDLDESDNELKNDAPEHYVVALEKGKTTYSIPVDLTAITGLTAGPRRMRIAVLRDADKDKFIAGEDIEWGRSTDITAKLLEGTSPKANDLAVWYTTKFTSGTNQSANQEVDVKIQNNGYAPVSDVDVKLVLDGNVMAEEVVSNTIDGFGGSISYKFTKTIDLSKAGVHEIEVQLPADGIDDNNIAKERVISVIPEAKDKLYALNFIGKKNEGIICPTVPEHSLDVTIEGWFRLEESQFATLFAAEGIWVASTYKMDRDVADNGIAVIVGNGMYNYSSPDVLMPGEYHHIAVTFYDDSNFLSSECEVHVYVDGKELVLTSGGHAGPDYSHFNIGLAFNGNVKMFRFWNKILAESEIQANMRKSLRDADGNLPANCLIEFMMNEGQGAYLASGKADFAKISSDRVDAGTNNVWVEQSLVAGVQFNGQLIPSKVEDDGTITFIMPHDFTELANVTGKILVNWLGTEITYKGAPVNADTKFDFSGADHDIIIGASLEIFGMHLKEDAVKIRLITDKNPGKKITKLDLLTADNANLKADVSFTDDTQTIVLHPEDKSATEKLDLTKLKVTFTRLSEGAKVLYAGQTIVQGGKLELDLTRPISVRVVAENGRDFNFYTIQVEKTQTITWDATATTVAYTNEAIAMPAATSSGNPVVYRSKDAHIATLDAAGNLRTAGVGTTTLYATAPADGLYAAAEQVSRDVTVTPAALTIAPEPMTIEEGEAVPEISLQYTGLLFDEVTSQFKQPNYEVHKDASTVWTPDLGPLAPGEYNVKAKGYTDPYADGNYMVTLKDGKLTVKPATKAKSVNFTVTDGSTAIDGAMIEIAGTKLTTAADGKASIKLLPGKHTYSASKADHQSVSGEVTVKDLDVDEPVVLPKLEVTLTYEVADPAQGWLAGVTTQKLAKNVMGSTVTAVPVIGFVFNEWKEDHKTEASRKDKSDTDKTFTATFKPLTYTLTYSVGEGGEWVDGDHTQNVIPGQDGAEVEVKAKDGYVFLGWSDGVRTLKRKDEKVYAPKEVTAQFYKPVSLPIVEDFDAVRGIPKFWSVDNFSTTGASAWAVGHDLKVCADGKVLSGDFIYVNSDNDKGGKKQNTDLCTPCFDVDGISEDIQLNFDLVFRGLGEKYNDSVSVEYRTDGSNWVQLAFYNTSNPYQFGTHEELYVPNSKLAGKKTLQFRWHYEAEWSYWAGLDNIVIRAKETGEVIEYIAKANGTLTGALQGSSKQTLIVTTPKGTLGEKVTPVPDAGYQFDRWSDNCNNTTRQDSENGRFIAFFKPEPKSKLKVTYSTDDLGKIEGLSYQEVESGASTQLVIAVPRNGKDRFVEWSDHSTDNPRVDKSVTADIHVKAMFAPRYRVTYGVKGNGGKLEAKTAGGQPLGDGLVDPDTKVTFTATPEEDYEVAGWTGVTATPANATTAKLTVTADADVRVAFKLKQSMLTFKVLKKGTTDPLQGAEVKLEDNAPKYTGGDGKVQFTKLQYGTYSYTVKLSGAQTVKQTVEVKAPTVEETVEMEWDGAQATFTVTDGTNPIQDAIVQVGMQQTKTDQYGKAVLSLDKKKYNYEVEKPGYYGRVEGTVDLSAGDKDVAVVLVRSKATVTFTVTAGGNPLEGATVTIEGKTATTDATGKAALTLPTDNYSYSVTKEGYTDATGTVDLRTGNKDVAVTLQKTATATFTVTAGGKSLEGATVTIEGKTATTDATGKAALTLPTDNYSYSVTKDGYTDATGTVDLRIGNKDVAVELERKTATATFAVTADGKPLQGATVTIEGKTATTDATGKAALTLPTDNYSYSVTKDGYTDATGTVDLRTGNKDVAVTLQKTATATFTVTAGGKPLEGATVTIAGNKATTDATGKAAIAELDRKAHDYVVTKKGYNDAKGSVDLTDGDKTVNVVLKTPEPPITAVESVLLANVVVAPNPFVETLHLTGVESLRTIRVFTVDGVLVLNHTHDGASEAIFQADSWKSGIYILRLIDLEGAVKQLRVVKQQ